MLKLLYNVIIIIKNICKNVFRDFYCKLRVFYCFYASPKPFSFVSLLELWLCYTHFYLLNTLNLTSNNTARLLYSLVFILNKIFNNHAKILFYCA